MQRHTVGDPVERFLMYQSARYIHFALLVVLDLETVIQDDNQPEVIHAYCVSLRERIVSQRAKFNERNGYSEPPTLGLRIVGVDSDSRKHTAATPSTGPTTHTPASAALGMRSTHFTQRQPSAVQSLSEDDLNVRPSATATTTASDRSGFGMTSKLRRTNLKYKKKKRPQHPPQATSLTEGVGTQGGSGDAVGTRWVGIGGRVTVY
ncbi:hypothetical protein SARC_13874 [Sphaeroforma arctica JP610]|uniref:Uncharacterized protein n=1 Tax=Sphaeroforma arctica JP610 TaxID=667725 RepID=A0A0L0FBX6_9EUKA|nr:hypothetical protein SARC_13874 [Sphaeroforma arctica JP610]KNC73568.1 hypothetical protein SARC_13874 [Sphaeroforma arctica JP610]|eukprot:XP_014147470.1 hypothetical protein SARC_13874 [Sphaeroforma arctica JP610]